mmetsp:Transcript_78632/g.188675  ORF Transcript_78632/g.188675 Transcript_78632/m.188675 type:complete len:244 (+) Transcript_78632:1038-1769(+)
MHSHLTEGVFAFDALQHTVVGSGMGRRVALQTPQPLKSRRTHGLDGLRRLAERLSCGDDPPWTCFLVWAAEDPREIPGILELGHKARQQRKFSRRAILSRFFRTVYAEIVATARKPCAAGVAHITSHGSDTDTESGASRAIHDIEGHGSFLVALDEAVCTTQLRLANISRRGNLDALFGPKPSTDCLAVIKRSILHFHGVPTDAAATLVLGFAILECCWPSDGNVAAGINATAISIVNTAVYK